NRRGRVAVSRPADGAAAGPCRRLCGQPGVSFLAAPAPLRGDQRLEIGVLTQFLISKSPITTSCHARMGVDRANPFDRAGIDYDIAEGVERMHRSTVAHLRPLN